ncbi:amino acid permease [Aristophania vespae]|uniref:Amino acid permease n=1 Tax=Aristophania vespae TaxID=2697033 RepID=A0A6P1NBB8_9PROT|nr:amino acid permease [Aristophania vespae]QHI95666.1 amino acid permease [Aristophania vespae]UMM63349.1 putative amino acid permease YhdG [Aristophania vespae]
MTLSAPPTPSKHDPRRKSLAQVTAENKSHGLKKKLTAFQLLLMGVGTTVGAGIYVMTGTAAAEYAGPSVLLSFLVAALACLFTALSYGELASTFPVSGSAYSYAYISMGEKAAWTVGWLLLLEYGISCTAVAAGLSGYATSLLSSLGIHIPEFLHQSTFQPVPGSDGTRLSVAWRFDAVGFIAIAFITWLLVRGIEETARFNTLIVVLKVGVLFLFMIVGFKAIHPSNWHPFIPPSKGNFHYGVAGIFRAASTIFYAYAGFEAVSTASSEARNPTRDVPIGIIGSLIICTLIYIAVAAVLLGIVPYQQLNVADPIAVATRIMNKPWLALLVNIGATIGLCSVLLGLMYAQSRVLLTIGRDQLIPKIFCRVHPKRRTPWIGTIIIGAIIGLMTATMPIDIISDLVSIGTSAAFGIVCFTVIWQRNKHPDTPRPFSVPFGGIRIKGIWIGFVPAIGIGFCCVMGFPLIANMIHSLVGGNAIPLLLLIIYSTLGVLTYAFYGRKNSSMAPHNKKPLSSK